MAYTPATIFPANLKTFQLQTPTYPNPRLAAPIGTASTTIIVTAPPKDETGAIITGGFHAGIGAYTGYVETIWVPVGAVSGDGLTWTGVVRGIRLTGLDYTTSDATLAVAHDADSPIVCNITAVLFNMMRGAMNGSLASGGLSWKIGDGTDSTVSVIAYNADTNKPAWRYNASTNIWEYSNDGVTYQPFGAGSGLTASSGVKITGGDIQLDTTTNASATTMVANNLGAIANTTVSLPAGEAVDGSTTPQLVYLSDGTGGRTSGRFYKADADDFTNMATNPIGFVTVNASSVGTSYSVVTGGVVSGFTGLTIGAPYFLSTTAGGITATQPSNAVLIEIGTAVSATQLLIKPSSKYIYATYSFTSAGTTSTTDTTISLGFSPKFLYGGVTNTASSDSPYGGTGGWGGNGYGTSASFYFSGNGANPDTSDAQLNGACIASIHPYDRNASPANKSDIVFTVLSYTANTITIRRVDTVGGSGTGTTIYVKLLIIG